MEIVLISRRNRPGFQAVSAGEQLLLNLQQAVPYVVVRVLEPLPEVRLWQAAGFFFPGGLQPDRGGRGQAVGGEPEPGAARAQAGVQLYRFVAREDEDLSP